MPIICASTRDKPQDQRRLCHPWPSTRDSSVLSLAAEVGRLALRQRVRRVEPSDVKQPCQTSPNQHRQFRESTFCDVIGSWWVLGGLTLKSSQIAALRRPYGKLYLPYGRRSDALGLNAMLGAWRAYAACSSWRIISRNLETVSSSSPLLARSTVLLSTELIIV